MNIKITTKNPLQTKKIGEILASEILKSSTKREKAFIIGLIGDLGGGKTTFLQGFAKELNIKEKILSPTFVILKRFKIKHHTFKEFYHIDCYRLRKAGDLLNLGLKEAVCDNAHIIALEWADKIKKIIPKKSIIIKFNFIDDKTREIVFNIK